MNGMIGNITVMFILVHADVMDDHDHHYVIEVLLPESDDLHQLSHQLLQLNHQLPEPDDHHDHHLPELVNIILQLRIISELNHQPDRESVEW